MKNTMKTSTRMMKMEKTEMNAEDEDGGRWQPADDGVTHMDYANFIQKTMILGLRLGRHMKLCT